MKKVIIIGAGPAGITAANELLKDTKGEYDVTILEETERIGGISQTVRYNGNRMDIGGHRFFSKNDEGMDLWRNLLPILGGPSMVDGLVDRGFYVILPDNRDVGRSTWATTTPPGVLRQMLGRPRRDGAPALPDPVACGGWWPRWSAPVL